MQGRPSRLAKATLHPDPPPSHTDQGHPTLVLVPHSVLPLSPESPGHRQQPGPLLMPEHLLRAVAGTRAASPPHHLHVTARGRSASSGGGGQAPRTAPQGGPRGAPSPSLAPQACPATAPTRGWRWAGPQGWLPAPGQLTINPQGSPARGAAVAPGPAQPGRATVVPSPPARVSDASDTVPGSSHAKPGSRGAVIPSIRLSRLQGS